MKRLAQLILNHANIYEGKHPSVFLAALKRGKNTINAP